MAAIVATSAPVPAAPVGSLALKVSTHGGACSSSSTTASASAGAGVGLMGIKGQIGRLGVKK
jgi:hypothetical protein